MNLPNRLAIVAALSMTSAHVASAALIPATWTGAGDGVNYNDPDNWDILDIPLNDLTDTYDVTIPAGASVSLVGVGGSNQINSLNLLGTLTVQASEDLTVINGTVAPGRIISTGGTATLNGAVDLSEGTATAESGGTITIADLPAVFRHQAAQPNFGGFNTRVEDILRATGPGSQLDFSGITSIEFFYNGPGEAWRHRIHATSNGQIDFSGVTAITGPVEGDDYLEFYINTGGSIDFSSLTTIAGAPDGVTRFEVRDTDLTLLLLEQADSAYFDIGNAQTLNLPELLNHTKGDYTLGNNATALVPKLTQMISTSVTTGNNATFDAPMLTGFENATINMADGSAFEAPNLIRFVNSTVTVSTAKSFTTGGLTDIDESRFRVESGAWGTATGDVLDAIFRHDDTQTDFGGFNTRTEDVIIVDGAGSELDLTSVTDIEFVYNGPGEAWRQRFVVTNNGHLDFSNVTQITGPLEGDDHLEFIITAGGTVDLSSLQTIAAAPDGITRFEVRDTGLSLPLLDQADRAFFDIGIAQTLNLPELTTLTRGDFVLDDNADALVPKLTQLTSTSVTLDNGASFNAPMLTHYEAGIVSIADGATFDAPNLTNFVSSDVTVSTTRTFNTGGLADIDESRFRVESGSWGAAEVLDNVFRHDDKQTDFGGFNTRVEEVLVVDGPGAELNLTSVTDIEFVFNGPGEAWRHRFIASNGGHLDFSNVTQITGPRESDDYLEFIINLGGTVDLSSLQTISASPDGITRFEVRDTDFSLPMLTQADRAFFDMGLGRTLSLPELNSLTRGAITLDDNATALVPKITDLVSIPVAMGNDALFDAPMLTHFESSTIAMGDGSTFDAPALQEFVNSSVTVSSTKSFNTGGLTDVDDSSFRLESGTWGTTDVLDTIFRHEITRQDFGGYNTRTESLLAATGPTSNLDLSSFESIEAVYNGPGEAWRSRITATIDAHINLSNVTQITGPLESDDRLEFIMNLGGTIDLSSLQTIASQRDGITRFEVRDANLTLPSLLLADRAYFDMGIGRTLSLPALTSLTRGDFVLDDDASVSAPQVTELVSTSISTGNDALFDAPLLTHYESGTITISDGATVNTPELTSFISSSVAVSTAKTFITGGLTDIDDSSFSVESGTWGTITGDILDHIFRHDDNNTDFGGYNTRVENLLTATGPDSTLDASSLTSVEIVYNGPGEAWRSRINALDGGHVDLSNVTQIIAPPESDDYLEFIATGGGSIDLSSLQSIASQRDGITRFIVDSEGKLTIGSLIAAEKVTLDVQDANTEVSILGDFDLDNASSINVGNGATVTIAGDFSHRRNTESAINFDNGILHFNGAGGQALEVASEDLGLPGPTAGNFGFKQIIIGLTEQRTSVSLGDLVDNGNRGGSGQEALYLFGRNGLNGLEINNNSALVLNGINVYAWDILTAQMVHLNSLFGPGDLRLPFDDGFIQLVPLDFLWDNNLGGDFNVATNWSDNLVPLPSDSAIWNLGSVAGYTVLFGSNVATDSAIFKTDRVTFDLGSFTYSAPALTATTGVIVGQDPGDDAELTVTNGTLSATSIRIAAAAGSMGQLTAGPDGNIIASELLTLAGDNDLALLSVEHTGTASAKTLNLGARGQIELLGGTTLVGSGPLPAPGTFRQTADGTLAIALDGTAATPTGLIEIVNGTADLAGTLELTVLDDTGLLPYDAIDFLLLTAGGTPGPGVSPITGSFDTITGMNALPDFLLAVTYSATAATVQLALPGDADLSASVDLVDLSILASAFGGPGTWIDGDFNGDGVVNLVDLSTLAAGFGTTLAPAVPEPAAAMALLTLASVLRRRRQIL
ncbi:MAG: hypothetical protein RLN76_04130 [Phycisphaeraceae bacterium]